MAREGIVLVAVRSPEKGQPIPQPIVHSVGVSVGPEGEDVDLEAVRTARQLLKAWKKEGGTLEELEEHLRREVRAVYRRELEKRPTVIPVILGE